MSIADIIARAERGQASIDDGLFILAGFDA
jgi:hypothetical protein